MLCGARTCQRHVFLLDQPLPFSGEFFGWKFPKNGIGPISQKLPYDVLFKVPKRKGENNDFEVDMHFSDISDKVEYAPSSLSPEAESKALMKMQAFPASIDLEHSDFLLRVLNKAFLPLFSKTSMRGYTHSEAIASIVPSTSPGFPANYNGHYEKRSVLSTMSRELGLFYHVCESYHTIFAISLKDELRPYEKVEQEKTRAFIISPIEHLYVCARVFGPFVEHFYSTRGTPSAIGVSPFNRNWHYEMSPVLEFSGLCGDSDGSAFDINQRANVHVLVLRFILQFLDESLHSKAIWCYREAITGFTITQQGYVFRRFGHNPSGWLLTAVVNTLVMYTMLACSFFDHYGYTDATFTMWFAKVAAKIFGDDNIYAVSRDIAHEYNPSLILRRLSMYAPFEGSSWFKPPTHVVFLQAYSRMIDGIWIPHFLNQKCWSSLYYVHKDLTAIQKLSKYTSLLKIYWFNSDFREYLLTKVREFISLHHDVCCGDPSWDSLVLESNRDFTLVYRNPQCRVYLNSSPIKREVVSMSANITTFDKQAATHVKDATGQIKRKEKINQREHDQKQFKSVLKGVYGRGLHSTLKAHSHYYRSLVDPFNTAGAKTPNSIQFVPTGTVQVVQRTTLTAVGAGNSTGIWVRPCLQEAIRYVNYVNPNYNWDAAASNMSAVTQMSGICQSIKPVSMGLAFQFLGNFNNNDGEALLAYIPGKTQSGRYNFANPTTLIGSDPITPYLQAPYMRTIPVNNGGGYITWRPTDYDSLDFFPTLYSPVWGISGAVSDPLGSLMLLFGGLANQTLRIRVTIVMNFEVIPLTNYVNLFNMTPAVYDPLEQSVVQNQLQQRLVPVGTNIRQIMGVMNSSAEAEYTTHHEDEGHLTEKMIKTMLPLVEGVEKMVA